MVRCSNPKSYAGMGTLAGRSKIGKLCISHFSPFFFGLVLYAASSGAAALAAGADSSWLWWSALLPIAASYWLSGILATSTSLHAMDRRLATLIGTAFSGATTVLVVALTVWVACRLGQWMPGNIA